MIADLRFYAKVSVPENSIVKSGIPEIKQR